MSALPVYLVRLPRSTDRRRNVTAVLRRLRIAFEIVDAADGDALVRGGAIPWSDAATLAPQPLLGRGPHGRRDRLRREPSEAVAAGGRVGYHRADPRGRLLDPDMPRVLDAILARVGDWDVVLTT